MLSCGLRDGPGEESIDGLHGGELSRTRTMRVVLLTHVQDIFYGEPAPETSPS